jgi:hypothetical protein
MTITEARKVLGKLGENLSDTEVLEELNAASFLKDMFFRMYTEGLKKKINTNDLLIKAVQ